jgi:hypothetical protein
MLEFSDLKKMPKALVKIQNEISNPKKNAKGMHNAKYATLDEVISVSKKLLANNGFTIIQSPYNDGEVMGVETMFLHESGEYIRGRFGSKFTSQDPQKAGGLITYYRRYSLSAMLNVASENDDDADSLKPKNGAGASDAQKKYLHSLIIEKNVQLTDQLISKLKTINGKNCSEAIKALQAHNISEFNKIVAR